MEKYRKMLQDMGADSAKVIDAATVVTAPWVRYKCQYGCAKYGKSWRCPPNSPTHKQTREMLGCFNTGILFSCRDLSIVTEMAVKTAREMFFDGYYKAIAFGSGPCEKCRECNEKGCIFPNDVVPAMEACGIDVFQTVQNNGYEIHTLRSKDETANYFGLILVE
jgi:predicted metal-binding protein